MLIQRMPRENPRWGCLRTEGELRKLGIRIGTLQASKEGPFDTDPLDAVMTTG